jgi:hypothetical protein
MFFDVRRFARGGLGYSGRHRDDCNRFPGATLDHTLEAPHLALSRGASECSGWASTGPGLSCLYAHWRLAAAASYLTSARGGLYAGTTVCHKELKVELGKAMLVGPGGDR